MVQAKHWVSSILLWTSIVLPSPLSSAALPPAVQAAPAAPSLSLPTTDAENTLQATSFKEAVQQWVIQLATVPGQEAWKQATWRGYPLGPGTHGWLVLIQTEGQDIGYMVIHAVDSGNPNKYQLTEYGSGGKPLFSLQTLDRSLVQLELINNNSISTERWYLNPFYAVWIVQSGSQRYYLDAATGESLPIEALPLLNNHTVRELNSDTSLYSEHTIQQRLKLPSFDPYEKLPWVKGTPTAFASFDELQNELNQQHRFTFTAELYEGKVRIAAAITGFQRWSNGAAFVLLEQHGQRAVPYTTLSDYGHLFR